MAKRTYRVKEGDNLADLSRKLKVPIAELQSANGIHNLTPGQTIRIPQTKGQAWATGENERKTTTVNGQQIRLGPNSNVAPRTGNAFQDFWKTITGDSPTSGESSVRGSLPSKVNGLASPTQYRGLGATGQAGGLTYQTGPNEYKTVNVNGRQIRLGPNSTYTPTNNSGGGYFPGGESSVRGSVNKGINGMFSPILPGLGVNSQIGGITTANQMIGNFAQQGYGYLQNQGMVPPVPQFPAIQPTPRYPVSTYRAPTPGQFSYAPQGQANSYTPYSPQQRQGVGEMFTQGGYQNPPQPAPFLTAQNLANPTYGNTPPAPQTNYGSYANGTPKTAQEAFQQGTLKVGKRWWIGRGKGQSAAPVINPLDLQAQNTQQLTWRV
jgi:hypothetical protein